MSAHPNQQRRIAIVVQRYGAEINGGAELHARLLAQALVPHYAVDVLTSRALDYRQWDLHYPATESWLDGCRVLRFDHPPRDRSRRKHMPLRHKLRFKLRAWLARRGQPLALPPSGEAVADGEQYLRAQGPTMDGLLQHLHAHAHDYAALIFFTALYHPSALGVLAAPHRAILVPTLHDEKAMYLPHFHRVFRTPCWIMYNTMGEMAIAQRLYGSDLAPGEVCGVGIGSPGAAAETLPDACAAWPAIAAQLGLQEPFLLYVGRVDRSKGCAELFAQFARLRRQAPGLPLKLVVCGQLFMPAPQHPDILLAGFIGNAERDALCAHALALVVPSRYESLSLVLLESLAAGCPVIVNRHCEVLRQHVQASGVGLDYADAAGFAEAVTTIQGWDAAKRESQAALGRAYVHDNYDWSRIVAKYRHVIDGMSDGMTDGTAAPST